MSTTLIIGPQDDLIERAARLIAPTGSDYSRNLVVFPGRRPAHFLRKKLALKETRGFIPPLILSMDGFVERVTEAVHPARNVETADAVAILYQAHRSAAKPLGGEGFLTLDSFFPLGIKIFTDIEELLIEGVPPSAIREIQPFADGMIPKHAQARLQSLHYFYETFYEKVSGLGMMTRSMKYRLATEKVFESDIAMFEKVIFAGFYALTRSEKDLFRKLQQREEVILLFQDGPGLGERLAEAGMAAPEPVAERSGPDIHFYGSPDTHGQVFALGSILREKREAGGVLDEKTAVVLPSSETLFPLLRQGMTCIDQNDFNISLGYPLHRTPVFGFLSNLMELIASMEDDRIYVPDYLKFVLHPYMKNIYCKGNAGITRIIFHTIEEILQKSRTRVFATLTEIEDSEKILNGITEKLRQEEEAITRAEILEHLRMLHHNTIERFLSFRDIGDFAARCIDLLTFIFDHSTARLHPLFSPFAESFVRALDTVSRSLLKGMSFADRTGYFTFFRKYVMTDHVPFPGTPLKGVQVLGFLETRNIRFDQVCILDANEELLPKTAREDTLLPFRAREILKLPTYADRDRLSAYYFDTLIRGAKDVHVFFVENDTKERSRFVESLLWEKQKKDRSAKARDYVQAIQYRVKLGNTAPPDIAKTDEVVRFLRGFSYSATALDIYLSCPLQFYHRFVLNLGRREEVTGEIERTDVGKFVHRVLSSYFSGKLHRVLNESDIGLEEMDRLIEDLFAREYGPGPTGAMYLLKTQIKAHLRDYLTRYRIPLIKEQKVTIIGVEEPLKATLNSHKLKGVLDAVETRDGDTCIIDYKSGSSQTSLRINFDKLDQDSRDSWSGAIGSLQLPFYLLLYSERHGIKPEQLTGMFVLLGRSLIDREIELPLFKREDERSQFGGLRRVISALLEEIADPSVPFTAGSRRKNSCSRCDFPYICGTQWVAG
jgi:hypothetical protein